jgi:hypothetical protein
MNVTKFSQAFSYVNESNAKICVWDKEVSSFIPDAMNTPDVYVYINWKSQL